jgi:glycosyltransferase involved in cell wall biosynthesis
VKTEAGPKDMRAADNSQLRVVLVVGDYPPPCGGIADYTDLLGQELVQLGMNVTVLTTKAEGQESRSLRQGVDIRRVMAEWHLSEIRSVLRVIDEMGPDTILNLMYGGFAIRRRPMFILLPLLLRALRPRCRVIVTIHEFRTHRTRWRAWTLPMITAAHGLIFVDEPEREYLLRWTKLKTPRMECIPIASNISPVPVTRALRRLWRERLDVSEDVPVITFFGGISRQKGLLDLLEAVNNLQRDGIPACLLLLGRFDPGYIGNQDYEGIVREAIGEGLSEGWIKFAENCPPTLVSEYLHASDIVVLPFVRGARSNNSSILAAIAHGLPVLTTKGIDTPEGFEEQCGVALVPAGDPGPLAERLKWILLSDEAEAQLKKRALSAATAVSWASLAANTAAFYTSFVKREARVHVREDVEHSPDLAVAGHRGRGTAEVDS